LPEDGTEEVDEELVEEAVLTEAEVVAQNIAFLETFVYVGGKTAKVKETKKKLEMEFEKVDQVGIVFFKFNKIMLFDLVPDLLLLSRDLCKPLISFLKAVVRKISQKMRFIKVGKLLLIKKQK